MGGPKGPSLLGPLRYRPVDYGSVTGIVAMAAVVYAGLLRQVSSALFWASHPVSVLSVWSGANVEAIEDGVVAKVEPAAADNWMRPVPACHMHSSTKLEPLRGAGHECDLARTLGEQVQHPVCSADRSPTDLIGSVTLFRL